MQEVNPKFYELIERKFIEGNVDLTMQNIAGSFSMSCAYTKEDGKEVKCNINCDNTYTSIKNQLENLRDGLTDPHLQELLSDILIEAEDLPKTLQEHIADAEAEVQGSKENTERKKNRDAR